MWVVVVVGWSCVYWRNSKRVLFRRLCLSRRSRISGMYEHSSMECRRRRYSLALGDGNAVSVSRCGCRWRASGTVKVVGIGVVKVVRIYNIFSMCTARVRMSMDSRLLPLSLSLRLSLPTRFFSAFVYNVHMVTFHTHTHTTKNQFDTELFHHYHAIHTHTTLPSVPQNSYGSWAGIVALRQYHCLTSAARWPAPEYTDAAHVHCKKICRGLVTATKRPFVALCV